MLEDYINLFIDEEYPKFMDKYLDTDTLNRIKNVGQFCGVDYTKLYNVRFFYSRFSHSLVTAHITWHFTHDKKSTIAALLHDVGTPAFAHTIDYVFDDYENQESSEIDIVELIKKDKKLMECLKSDNISLDDLQDLAKYPILENKSPRLCADRLDGVLHTSYIWLQKKSLEEIKEVYNSIVVLENEDQKEELGFDDLSKALKFCDMVQTYALELQGNKDKFVMKYIADVVKVAVEKNYITLEDLYKRKEQDIVKIFETKIKSWYNFNKALEIKGVDKKPDDYAISVNAKKRNVVPLVKVNGVAQRIDKVSSEAKMLLEEFLNFKDKTYAYVEGIKKIDW